MPTGQRQSSRFSAGGRAVSQRHREEVVATATLSIGTLTVQRRAPETALCGGGPWAGRPVGRLQGYVKWRCSRKQQQYLWKPGESVAGGVAVRPRGERRDTGQQRRAVALRVRADDPKIDWGLGFQLKKKKKTEWEFFHWNFIVFVDNFGKCGDFFTPLPYWVFSLIYIILSLFWVDFMFSRIFFLFF